MPVEQKLPYRTPEVPASFGTFHWPTIVVGLIALLGANVIGTQFIASRFNYARALGTPLFQFGEYGFYAPWKWALWFLHYNKSNIPYVKNTVEIAIIMIVVLSAFSAAYVIVTNFRRSKKVMEGQEDIHGSARFATKEDLIQNGILKCEEGVYIGGFQDQQYVHYLKHNGPEHVIVAAPTRSGKGVGIVIPTLLGWVHVGHAIRRNLERLAHVSELNAISLVGIAANYRASNNGDNDTDFVQIGEGRSSIHLDHLGKGDHMFELDNGQYGNSLRIMAAG